MSNYKDIPNYLKMMPTHKAPETVWGKITPHLEASDPIQKAISKLPRHIAPETLWNTIDGQLSKTSVFYLRPLLAVAASLVILFTITLLVKQYNHSPQIEVAEEYLNIELQNTTPFQSNTDVNHYCQQFPDVCVSTEYTTLKQQIEVLKAQKNELKSMQKFDSDPDINLYLERINLEMATVERKLLALF